MLINVDGVDGSGKSTLVNNLINYYEEKGAKTTFVHFPRYDADIGQIIKKHLNGEVENIHPASFQMLYSADRLNWCTYELYKLKREFDIIFVDRYITSGIVYGMTDGLESKEILFYDRRTLKPNVNLILLCNAKTSLQRMDKRGEKTTKYEYADRIEEANFNYSNLHKIMDNIHYIDANNDAGYVFNQSINIINKRLEDLKN